MHLHTLKGTAATVGAMGLSAAVARLELLCKGARATVNVSAEMLPLEALMELEN